MTYRHLIIGVAVAVVIFLFVGGVFLLTQNKKFTPAVQENTQTSNSVGNSNIPSAYKDGTYTAEGDYITHGGPESISVTVILKDGVIELADVKSQARDQMSTLMQGKFISGYKPLVEGKNIDEVSLTNVSGSSLTPIGFEDALSKIKAQASS